MTAIKLLVIIPDGDKTAIQQIGQVSDKVNVVLQPVAGTN